MGDIARLHEGVLAYARDFMIGKGFTYCPEAGGVGGQRLRQLVLPQDLIDKLSDHGVFAGTDEVQVLTLYFIHHGVHVRLAHDALQDADLLLPLLPEGKGRPRHRGAGRIPDPPV